MKKLIVLLMLLATYAEATTRYVAKTGSDANSCAASTSTSTPKLTIASGITCMAAGDVLQVRTGTYAEGFTFTSLKGTSFANAITIQRYPAENPVIQPSGGSRAFSILGTTGSGVANSPQYIIIDGFDINCTSVTLDCIKITYPTNFTDAAHHIRITNNIIRNAFGNGILITRSSDGNEITNNIVHDNGHSNQEHGIYLGSAGNLVDGNQWYNNYAYGMHFYNSVDGLVNNNIIRNNVSHHNWVTTDGNNGDTVIAAGSGNLFYNNIIYDNPIVGLQINGSVSSSGFYNNVIYNTGTGIQVRAGASNNILRNNIASTSADNVSNSGTNTSFSNMLCSSADTGCNASTEAAGTTFTNAGSGDFTLKAGSLAIDNGTSLSSTFTTDIIGTARPQGGAWDIGAYEKASVAGPTLTLINPNGGTLGVVSSSQTFTWGFTDAASVPNVKLSYDAANDGTFETVISASTANDGSFAFTAAASPTTTGRFKVEDAADGSPSDTSDANVTITAAAGGSFTKIISNNTSGANPGDIPGVSDGRIYEFAPTTNYATGSMYIHKVGAGDHSNGLLKFDGLTQVPATAAITSVTLGLNVSDGATATAETFDIRRLLRTWDVTTATWNVYSTGNSWTTVGGLGAATDRVDTASAQITGVTATPGYFSVTVTDASAGTLLDDVKKIVNGTYSNLGWHIERNGTGNDGAYRNFTSSEGTDGFRPYLGLIYTTTAATIILTSPSATSHFFPGDSLPIRWAPAGFTGNVQVDISYNNGVSYQSTPIIASIPFDQADGLWTVTGPACTQCKIKVTSITDTAVFAESPAFKIAGTYLGIR